MVLVFCCSCNPTHHQRISSTRSFVFHSLPFPVSTANKYLCNGREKGDGGERGEKKGCDFRSQWIDDLTCDFSSCCRKRASRLRDFSSYCRKRASRLRYFSSCCRKRASRLRDFSSCCRNRASRLRDFSSYCRKRASRLRDFSSCCRKWASRLRDFSSCCRKRAVRLRDFWYRR